MHAHLSTGRTYHYIDEHTDNYGTTLLCIHGFPDIAYGWRHQIPSWVARGYRVIAPDMLGYGKTDMPLDASAYTTKRLCNDLAALLDHLGVRKAVVIGHDWGSVIASSFALWYPDRLLALALLSAPYTPPPTDFISLHERVQQFPSFGYQLYFASEQSAAEIEAHLPLFFRLLFRAPTKTRVSLLLTGELRNLLFSGKEPEGCILNDEELDHYISNFQRGMTGPLSYYRTTQARFEEDKALPSKLRADLPVLFLYGVEDGTCPPAAVQNMGKFIDQLQVVPLSGVGHWIMLEAPQPVTDCILKWLDTTLGRRTPASL